MKTETVPKNFRCHVRIYVQPVGLNILQNIKLNELRGDLNIIKMDKISIHSKSYSQIGTTLTTLICHV